MLEPSPVKRIDLKDLLEFVQNYDREQQTKRIEKYKQKSKSSRAYYGLFGSVINPFISMMPLESSPSNLDMKMCSKLLQEIQCWYNF